MATEIAMHRTFDSPDAVMRQALELAQAGAGRVEPNPLVGAVLVDDDLRLLGSGCHLEFGGPHAEVHAIAAAGSAARGATLYVTLEPCCHAGKTPPCVDAILAAGIRKVVVGTIDPASHARGAGIAALREAGVEVQLGLLEYEAQQLIAPFAKLMTTGRPFVHAKWAMSLDGRIATRTGDSKWISSAASRQFVHELRGRMDAVLVGIGTALADDPLLTSRPPGRRVATRVIVDSRARLPVDSRLVRSVMDAPVLVMAGPNAPSTQIDALRGAGVEVLVLAEEVKGRPSLSMVMNELGSRQMTNVLVEGGAAVLGSVFDHRLADMAHVFISPRILGGRDAWPAVGGLGCELLNEAFRLVDATITTIGVDLYVSGRVGL